jgi:class 3 adenylate cyclase
MTDERAKNVRKVAKMLAVDDGDMLQYLDNGRLAGVLVDALRSKGMRATPAAKSSIEKLVNQLQPTKLADTNGDAGAGTGAADLLTGEMTVTIMFTDIVGSTELQQRLGDRKARGLMRAHDEIIRQRTREHGGIEVKATGDGFMLTFPSANRAASATIAMQQDLHATEFLRPDIAIAIKLGISVGEPIREQQDLFGMSVVLASRIGAKADPGQILAPQIVYGLLGDAGGFKFTSAGEHSLKGIPEPQKLYEVSWRGS